MGIYIICIYTSGFLVDTGTPHIYILTRFERFRFELQMYEIDSCVQSIY